MASIDMENVNLKRENHSYKEMIKLLFPYAKIEFYKRKGTLYDPRELLLFRAVEDVVKNNFYEEEFYSKGVVKDIKNLGLKPVAPALERDKK